LRHEQQAETNHRVRLLSIDEDKDTMTITGKRRIRPLWESAVVLLSILGWASAFAFGQQAHNTWREYGGNSDSSNYSVLKQINLANVSKLQVAWTSPTGDQASYAASPIVVDRTMYAFAKNGALIAMDAGTGQEIWVHPLPQGALATRQRGMSYWESQDRSDRRILIAWGLFLYAIDAQTGKGIDSFGTHGRVDLREGLGRDPQTIGRIQSGGPGRVFENLIIMGSSTGEAYVSPPGDIRAYDVRSGRLAWTFHTVPHPGEVGYNTWPKDAWQYIGGVNDWGDMTIDEKRGMVFLPLGSPTYDFYGGDRKGDNLFGNCVLALDARTGKYLWHFQAIHHDLWDYDLVSAPQLLTVQHDGKPVDVVAQAGKNGFLYVLERDTGKPLWPIEERPVPKSDVPGEFASPTQPFPTKPPPFARQKFTVNDLNPYLSKEDRERYRGFMLEARNEGIYTPASRDRFVVNMPGHSGGSAQFSTSADGGSGLMYVVSFDGPAFLKLETSPAATSNNSYYGPLVPGRQGCEAYNCAQGAAIAGAQGPSGSAETGSGSTAQGRTVYQQNCQACHGSNLAGTGAAPSLQGIAQRLGEQAIRGTIRQGGGQMPAFTTFSDSSLNDLIAFLRNPGEVAAPDQADETPYPAGVRAPAQRYYSGYGFSPGLIGPPWSTLTAYDLNTGTIQWQRPYGSSVGVGTADNDNGILQFHSSKSSVVVTAGGLLFSATTDRKFRAYDQKTGRVVWSTDLPDRSMGIPAVYELDGREYVVISTRGAYMAFALPKTLTMSEQQKPQ
jgi:quinoprotein glucose dehydrogenase